MTFTFKVQILLFLVEMTKNCFIFWPRISEMALLHLLTIDTQAYLTMRKWNTFSLFSNSLEKEVRR